MLPAPESASVPAVMKVPVGVHRRQDRGARANLIDGANAGNHAVEGDGVGAVEGKCAIVGDIACDGARSTAIAKLQRAAFDGPVLCARPRQNPG
jgi:hypothetical protein